jgi:hypothetical protein
MARVERSPGGGPSKRSARKRGRSQAADTSGKVIDSNTPQDVTDVRAKSQRHRKSTADKWNQ